MIRLNMLGRECANKALVVTDNETQPGGGALPSSYRLSDRLKLTSLSYT